MCVFIIQIRRSKNFLLIDHTGHTAPTGKHEVRAVLIEYFLVLNFLIFPILFSRVSPPQIFLICPQNMCMLKVRNVSMAD